MRATRAYIAGAGTAVVMLGASLAMFVMLSTFVAFGSWPGATSGSEVNRVVLADVVTAPKAKPIGVRADAVTVARRAAARRQAAVAQARAVGPVATQIRIPALPTTRQVVTRSTPTRTTTPATPAPAQPPVQQVAQTVRDVGTTTRRVGTQLQQHVQSLQTQVNQVVGQVVGDPSTNTPGLLQRVTGATGSLLGG